MPRLLLAILASLAIILPAPATAQDDITIDRLFGPEIPDKYKHPASIGEFDNGDLYAVYYVAGKHASERLEERSKMEWQSVAGLLDHGELVAERPDSVPNPSVEVRESLPDGTEFMCVWSILRKLGVAKLVTVHFFDEG